MENFWAQRIKEMTIDEFKKDIAPHINKGYVAMDKDNTWCHFPRFAVECLQSEDMVNFWNFEGYER